MLEIDRLTKRFGAFVAVDHVSLSVAKGEVLGFLGPNGAGKSTTMKMASGFLTPDGGTARICGFDIQDAPIEAKTRLGYLPEGAPGYGDMTAVAFLAFCAEARGLSGYERDRRVALAAARLQLEAVLEQPIDTLSKGFKRRVGLAQAILHDPPVLIMDEPTDGLDPNQKFEVRRLIRDMRADKAIVISTHILEEVDAVCDRAVIIAGGKVVADGTPAELAARSRYHHAAILTIFESPAAASASAALAALPGVAVVEPYDARKGVIGFTVLARPGAEVLDTVAELARKSDWEVEELRAERGHLDEVFRSITLGAGRS
ncbi:MAG: ABC transporter ATP-binding protein [Alphaproteobacteria bacterium]|nr:ABC transporter ATP-binding protein [Alphaproteobacteria bacterium]